MRLRAVVSAIAAIGLARDDRWAQHAFGPVVGGVQFVQFAQQVCQALLFESGRQRAMVVGSEAITRQHRFELLTQDVNDDFMSAPVRNLVGGSVLVGEDPEPGRQGPDAPPGFVHMHDALHCCMTLTNSS